MTREERDKAIRILQWLHDNDFLFRSTEEDVKYATKLGIQALEQTRWIPVSDMLPEYGTYLICTEDGYVSTIMYDRSMGWLLSAKVIAWMPLPQPYKAESEE